MTAILALILVCTAAVFDWRSRRIPNWLTVSGLAAGLALNSVLGKWAGAKLALAGAGLGLGLLLPLVILRAMGAGDWKLMGALGGVVGAKHFWKVLLASIFIAGAMALFEMIRKRRVKETLVNVGILIHGVFTFSLRPYSALHAPITLDNPALLKLPFGVAVAVATVLTMVAARLGVWR